MQKHFFCLFKKKPYCKPFQGPLSVTAFFFLTVVSNLFLYHLPLFTFANAQLNLFSANGIQTLTTVIMVIVLVSILLLLPLLLLSQFLFKLLLSILIICNSLAMYFMMTYQVILDRTMIGNILNTSTSEVNELLHFNLYLYVFFFGLLPLYWLWRTCIETGGRLRLSLYGLSAVFICLGWVYFASHTWFWIDKHAKNIGGKILPWGYVINTVRYWHSIDQQNQPQLLLPDLQTTDMSASVVVLVIGETARAKNFEFYGYERDTNPLLSTTDIIPMAHPVACSTYTTKSLRCMLSHQNLEQLDAIYEYLPSYLNRHGVDVIWRTNNWGEPPINVTSYTNAATLRDQCEGKKCALDDVLHTGLLERIKSSTHGKVLVVLHQKGSHGPLYSKRYSDNEEVFTPACKTVNLSQCTKKSLLNAYDNSLLHTDQFLYETIKMLQKIDVPSAMLYMSDHGESLGENGLYLHGTPYSFAPDEQKDIPMLVWMSPSFKQHHNLHNKNINWRNFHGHELVFHSVVGALGFSGGAYDAKKDIFIVESEQ